MSFSHKMRATKKRVPAETPHKLLLAAQAGGVNAAELQGRTLVIASSKQSGRGRRGVALMTQQNAGG
jgi:hypothetical protein